MATVAEVLGRAGNDLAILQLGQSLPAQHQTRLEAGYNEIYAMLKKKGLAVWASDGEIPAELVVHVVALIADNCLNTYGVSDARLKRIKAAVAIAIPEIRKLASPDYVSQDEPTDY